MSMNSNVYHDQPTQRTSTFRRFPRELCGHGGRSECCSTGPCAGGAGAKVVMLALASAILSCSTAQANMCLASADEVRKLAPKAWPRWTYGPARERCWYFGQKPVFAKLPPSETRLPQVVAPETTSKTLQDEVSSPEPVNQPWALEYRWIDSFEMRHKAQDEPLGY